MAEADAGSPRDLYIIEAPGKVKVLEEVLSSLGYKVVVQATKGHIFSMPRDLNPLGIDRAMRDFSRVPTNLKVVERIRLEAQNADRVIVATDADTEGDVIAWDVAEIIRDIHPDPLRVRLKGMDPESVVESLNEMKPVSKEDAIPGRTRAIIDRLIGATFYKDGVSVGRVKTAILGVLANQKPSVRTLRLVAPAKDNGRPWVAETQVRNPLDPAIADRLADLEFPKLDLTSSSSFTPPPANMGDIMVRAGDKLGMSPMEASEAMQSNYESGRMSYPRAGSRGMSRGALRKMAKMMRQAQSGYKFDESKVADKAADAVHDAPYPIGKINLAHDPKRLGHVEGLRAMVARDMVKSGQEHRLDMAGTDGISKFLVSSGFSQDVADHVAGLHWRREHGPGYPGQERWAKSGVIERRPDTVVLEAVLNAGLGRPSTWASHVKNFLEIGLVDKELNLTGKGKAWVKGSPPEFLDPRMSAAIETACEKVAAVRNHDPGREPWEVLAEKIIERLPAPVRSPLQASVSHEEPRAKIDPITEYGLGYSAVEEMRSREQLAYMPPE